MLDKIYNWFSWVFALLTPPAFVVIHGPVAGGIAAVGLYSFAAFIWWQLRKLERM